MPLLSENLDEQDRYVKMTARYDGSCTECEEKIIEGDTMFFDTKERKAYCYECGKDL